MTFFAAQRNSSPLSANCELIKDLNWQARKSGKSLGGTEYDLARKVGVTHLEDVRILPVGKIPASETSTY